MGVQQIRWLARAWAWGPGRSALREVYASYVLLLVVVVVVFGGNGLQPRTIVSFARSTPSAAAVLFVFWVAMSSRAYRAVVLDPSWPMLRTFPLTGASILCVGSVFLLLVELPWLVLWTTGAGIVAGVIAVGCSLSFSYLWIGMRRIRVRFLPTVIPSRPFLAAALGFGRTLVRRYTRATLLGIGLWAVVTTLVIAMLQRQHETLEAKSEFGAAAFSMFSVVITTTSQWLLLQEERKARWLFTSSAGGNRVGVFASVGVALAFSLGLVFFGSGMALLVARSEGVPCYRLGMPLLRQALLSSLALGTLGSALQRRWASETNAARTAVRAPLSMLLLLFLILSCDPLSGVLVALVSGFVGFALLRAQTQSLAESGEHE